MQKSLRGHSCRGILTGASKYKFIRWARIVMVFLLVVVTVAWLFVDIEDLNIRQRYSGQSFLHSVLWLALSLYSLGDT